VLGKTTRSDRRGEIEGEQTVAHVGGSPRLNQSRTFVGLGINRRILRIIPRCCSLGFGRVMTCSVCATSQRHGRAIGVSACLRFSSVGLACASSASGLSTHRTPTRGSTCQQLTGHDSGTRSREALSVRFLSTPYIIGSGDIARGARQ
jgi:hypothetical protein